MGFVAGDGYVALDNDQGKILDRIITRVCLEVLGPRVKLLRRFVASPGHSRSAFLFRVLNFIGDPVRLGNQTLKFECTGVKSELQVLAQGKQFVVAGVHPGTGAAYVLSRRVTSLADIPDVTPEQFDLIIEGVIAETQALGWKVEKTGAAKAAPGAQPKRGPKVESASAAGAQPEPPPGADALDAGDFEEVVWILERLPNRDAPPGERTDWDEFLDDYSEYLKILYAICGGLGDTPEVERLAMAWANGRVQIKQSAESAWASIVSGNPSLGMHHLKQLAWRFIGKEYVSRQFPDFTPEEEAEIKRAENEARKTGWDHFQEALRWPGQEKALKLSSGVARNKFGAAMIGKGASTTPSMARQWVTDRHARGHVSMLSGLPACGKTELDVAYAHAMATERPDLVGLSEMDRYGAVVFLALDSERAEEFKMRGEAFRKYHGLQPCDFKHEIYVIDDCGPVVERQSDKTFEPSRGIVRVAKFLAECRECENLSIVVVDTVLGAAGGADTADPSTTGAIMRVSKEIGILLNCSTDLINHHTKGGALRNPDGMDAALGTRDASATTRFMTNLKKEGNYVRVVQAKQSYHGPKGCFLYEFKSVDIVSVRPEDPTRTVVQSIGVLVPAAKSAAAGAFAAEDAHQALWEAHDTRKIKIKRKSGKTAKGKDYASVIIEDAGAVDYASPGGRRGEAERLLDLLIKDKRIEVVEEWVNRNQVEFIVPKEPEELV